MPGNQLNLRLFPASERGSVSVMSIFLFLVGLLLSGVAIEFASLRSTRAQLQAVADAAAHAALYVRDEGSREEAVAAARQVAEAMTNPAIDGVVVRSEDVTFGIWDAATRRFTPLPGSTDAVRVIAGRTSSRGNALAALIYQIVGRDWFDVSASAVFETWLPPCLREGFVAEGVVDLQSNNNFRDGFCVHSNTHVEINQNNFFEPGTVVQMPDKDDLVLPASGFDRNEGLAAALREGRMNLRLLQRLDAIEAALLGNDPAFTPDYVTAGAINEVAPAGKLTPADFAPGRINRVLCRGNSSLTLSGSFSRTVIVTNCKIKFARGSRLEDALIYTSSTDDASVSAPSGLQIGRDDDCADGGGAQIVTRGGARFASKLSMFNGQIIAAGDVDFAAQANGIKGAAILAGGRIDGTSRANMGYCGRGMDQNLMLTYFRLVA